MNRITISLMLMAMVAMTGCGGGKDRSNDPLGDSGRTQRTENLLASLERLAADSTYLFGHADDALCGVGWTARNEEGGTRIEEGESRSEEGEARSEERSDVRSVCGDYPAVQGFDLSGLEQAGDSLNADGIPFSRIREAAIRHFDRGGVVSMTWRADGGTAADGLSRIADFLNSLETPYGVTVPVLLRPAMPMDKAEWQEMVKGLRKRGVVSVLYVYAPGDAEQATLGYPGNDYVDVVGVWLDAALDDLCDFARQHGKVAALVEAVQPDDEAAEDWWTGVLAPAMASHQLGYVMTGRNARSAGDGRVSCGAPYPGHPASSDFVRFYNLKQTLFLRDVNGLYLKH